MLRKTIIPALFQFFTIYAYAQTSNFTYIPEKPKPGEVITIFYEPSGKLKGTTGPIETVVYQQGGGNEQADNLELHREGGKYTGSFRTDTVMDFVYLSFSVNNQYDNNNNEGYCIHLYQNNEIRKGSYISEFTLYQYFGSRAGVETDNEMALAALEKEFSSFPESKKPNLLNQIRLQMSLNREASMTIAQKTIESLIKSGLIDETDYTNLAGLYELAKLPEQAKLINAMKKDKIPGGNWARNEKIEYFYAEKDPAKKETLLNEINELIKNNIEWKEYKNSLDEYKSHVAAAYLEKVNMTKVREISATINEKSLLALFFNHITMDMLTKNEHLDIVEEISAFTTEYAKSQWQQSSTNRPSYITEKEWRLQKKNAYAQYEDTYARVLYRKGDYKKGYLYAKDAAISLSGSNEPDYNTTYSLLAEKIFPSKKIKPELETFVKNGAAANEIINILKDIYAKNKKDTFGFSNYISILQKKNSLNIAEQIRKSVISEKTPSFALYNINGQKVDFSELKGKVIVIDFWATWCGPCKASFPGMQKMVTKYKDNPDVKFFFIDTWENAEDKRKNAADFIKENNYTFEVLLDNDNTVVEDFKVEGVPKKFVIDKSGKIIFKTIGYSGSEDRLIAELSAMIEIASESK
ncbi:MAG: TlpA disulfide reductase family protein [Bacteroidetes bacterium]|nr:TlpA disulfide reductase family protein [Bacteroidota bacterium]